jgi:hypothetical protein
LFFKDRLRTGKNNPRQTFVTIVIDKIQKNTLAMAGYFFI